MATEFGIWLQTRMVELQLSVTELAKMLGTDMTTVSHWRRGNRTPPTPMVGRLAKALHTTELAIQRQLEK